LTGILPSRFAWSPAKGKILPFPTDFEGFLTLLNPVDFVVFSQVCPPGHSFLDGNVYK
jgi:hypothetical protein